MTSILEHKLFVKFLYFVLGTGCIIYATTLFSFKEDTFENLIKFGYENWYLLLLSISLYLLSHLVRVIRLIILSPNKDIRIRLLIKEQFKANGVNLLIPFRLGEAYRLIYFKNFFGSYANSLAVLVCERLLDILIIFSLLASTVYISQISINEIEALLYVSLMIIVSLLFILFILDEILEIINQVLIQKETTTKTVQYITLIANLVKAIRRIKTILNHKIIPCIVITIIVWMLEISVFYIFLNILENRLDLMIILALSVSLSSLLPGGPLGYGGVQLSFYLVGLHLNNQDLVSYSIIYSLFIFGSGLLFGSSLFFMDFFKKPSFKDE
jgi:hypothetical protein